MARAIDVAPNDPAFHAHMAWYSHQASALPEFERERLTEHHLAVALEIDPDNAEAHYVQGMLWSGDGNTTRARIALNTALKTRPDYVAAANALGRLDRVVETPAPGESPGTGTLLPRRRTRKLRLPLVVATTLVALVGAGSFFLSSDAREFSELSKQLGTTLSVSSASRVSEDLYVDVGTSWDKMPVEDRAAELTNIGQRAKGLGVANVYIYAFSQPVAEIHADKICIGPCAPVPAASPAQPGSAPAAATTP
jgi:tetratricopeptide (TPR) repeat protein